MGTSILSWNVAGIRACIKKGGLDFLLNSKHHIVCFQETKAEEQQVKLSDDFKEHYPFRYWNSTQGITQRKGLSGTAIWSKIRPIKEIPPMDIDVEGRTTTLEFDDFILLTVYTPNSQKLDSERFIFRTTVWDPHFQEHVKELNKIKPVILCGDFNVAYKEIDLHNPKQSRNKNAGFIDDERVEFGKLLNCGFIDCFRTFCEDGEKYTYWDQRNPLLRVTNKGWRIDYFLSTKELDNKLVDCKIHPEIMGSDHCPSELLLSF